MVPGDARFRVLFVCSGNTCRSPLATGALRQALGDEAGRIDVTSAGTGAWDGEPATPHAVAVAARDGVDLSGHRARRATGELVRQADLVLAMERAHLETLKQLGANPERTFLLGEWPEPGEPELVVSDPYGGSIEAYEECWRRIRRHVRRVAPRIIEAVRARSV